jgi:hypothetical protein
MTSLYEPVTLAASATVTETGNGSTEVRLPKDARAVAFVLDLTDAKTAAGDKLDVYVQVKLDGVNWVDAVHFTQILGNGSNTLRFFAKVTAAGAEAVFENGTALGAAAVRNLIGLVTRVRWAVVSGDTPSFTFSAVAIPM